MIKRAKTDHFPLLPLLKIQSDRHRIQPANVQAFGFTTTPIGEQDQRRIHVLYSARPGLIID
jgi:hypothetical protein